MNSVKVFKSGAVAVGATRRGAAYRRLVLAFAVLGLVIGFFTCQAVDAQYQYTDDKGSTKVAPYKLNVPEAYRDAAVWIGPTGTPTVSPPSSTPPTTSQRVQDANRRIGTCQ